MHDDAFIGLEKTWTSFFEEGMNYFSSTSWHEPDKVIPYRPGPNAAATIFEGHAPCRDEATVQSRFIQNVSQHMNAICEAANAKKEWVIISLVLITLWPEFQALPNKSEWIEDCGRNESLVDFRAQFAIKQGLQDEQLEAPIGLVVS